MNIKCILITFYLGAILKCFSQGYIVTNGVTFLGFNGQFYETHVVQDPKSMDYTGFILVQQSDKYSFSSFADEGVRAFIVSPGDPISLQAIVDLKYPELASVNLTFDKTIPVYLGFYTGRDPWIIENGTSIYTGIYKDPVFGWGEFVNLNGTITMLDSGLEYGGGGIYAGTLNIIAVPEPTTWALTALGGMILFWKNRHF